MNQEVGLEGNPGNNIPQFLKDLVGKTYTFQLKLSTYNFTSKHQSFTISRIFEAPEVLPNATFTTQVKLIFDTFHSTNQLHVLNTF